MEAYIRAEVRDAPHLRRFCYKARIAKISASKIEVTIKETQRKESVISAGIQTCWKGVLMFVELWNIWNLDSLLNKKHPFKNLLLRVSVSIFSHLYTAFAFSLLPFVAYFSIFLKKYRFLENLTQWTFIKGLTPSRYCLRCWTWSCEQDRKFLKS